MHFDCICIHKISQICDLFFRPLSFFSYVEKRREFERRRKLHYNEFEAVMRARQLMEQDEDEEEMDDTPLSTK